MGGVKVSVHPLFFIYAFFYAITGKIFVFTVYTATAVLHELGHSFVSSKLGYKLNKITLMPFGALVTGDTVGMSYSDEVKIALAGPLFNIFIGLMFVASWWIFPETYAYTDIAAEANFSTALINFLPAYSLDGGRIFASGLSIKTGRKKANTVCKILSGIIASFMIATFILSLKNTPNYSVLLFVLFIVSGIFEKGKSSYVRIYSGIPESRLLKGANYKKIAIDKNATLKRLYRLLDEDSVNEVVVYSGKTPIAVLDEEKLCKIFLKRDLSKKISDCLYVK